MNERINDLWQQAACFVNPLKEGGDWQAEFVEKFAELIVQECADFLKDKLDDHFAAEQLEEHFGVEE